MTRGPDTDARTPSAYKALDRGLTKPMGVLGLLFLVALTTAVPQLKEDTVPPIVFQVSFALTLLFWPLFLIEYLFRRLTFERRRPRSRTAYSLAVCIIPPLRIGLRPFTARRCVWIPFLGWQRFGRPLSRRLEKRLSGPMMGIALMILPVLALEFIWMRQVEQHYFLELGLEIATRIIWLAFALELVVMLAATRRKLEYCRTHFIDVLIVCFPFISFLRVLRIMYVGQLVRASRVASMARAYRLRAVLLRLFRALLLLRIVERLSPTLAEKRLVSLRQKLKRRQEELAELKEEIVEFEEHVAMAKARRAAKRESKKARKAARKGETETPPPDNPPATSTTEGATTPP